MTARSPIRSAPVLAARGLLLVGLDAIGDWLTEVNVTSPTCFREIMDQTGFDVAAHVHRRAWSARRLDGAADWRHLNAGHVPQTV